jgi:hypothetical protein
MSMGMITAMIIITMGMITAISTMVTTTIITIMRNPMRKTTTMTMHMATA